MQNLRKMALTVCLSLRLTNVSQSLDIQQTGGGGYYLSLWLSRGIFIWEYYYCINYDDTYFVELSFYLLSFL